MNKLKIFIVCLLILTIGGLATYFIYKTEPEAQREGTTKQTAMLVEVISPEEGSFQPKIIATGTVAPSKEVMLTPIVNGEVVYRSSAFTPGEIVYSGQILARIDTSDYSNVVKLRESELIQAKTNLKLEMGRQEVARKDFQLIGESISQQDSSLVLRKPQLEAARATILSAEANLKQAKLNFNRTAIRAPFTAQVLSRNIEKGSFVNTGTNIGRMVGINSYWIMANLPMKDLQYLKFSNGQGKGSEVIINNKNAWPTGISRKGRLFKMVGTLQPETRMASVIIEVNDPLGIQNEEMSKYPLIIGSFVEVVINGKELEDITRLERAYLRKDNSVWTMRQDSLSIKKVNVVYKDDTYAYISSGLTADVKVVTTNLSTTVEGAKLRTATENATSNQKALSSSE